MKMMTVHPNSNTMTYIINPHYQNLSKIFSNSLTIARNTPESGALQIHSDLQLHPATVDMLLEENATILYSSMGHDTSVRPHHKNYQHCQPVAVPCSFRYTDVYISADSNSSCASNKSKIKLCYNQESLLLQHSFSPWLLVDVDTADEIPCLSFSEPLQLECDSAFSAGDKIPINISLNNLETARMDLEDSKQDLEDEMLAKTLDSLQNIKKLNEVVDLNEEIGRGAYGTVKKVSLYGTPCAAKDIHAILIDYADERELKVIKIKYLNECINCSKLLHPNIVQFLGIHYPSEDAQLPWLVMEKMDCNLTSFLVNHSQGNVSVNAKISIVHDVSLGLKYLHTQDFIHRDLSSNNILLTKHLTAKIADLGVAKLLDPDDPKTHTLAPGTLHFLPPEATCANPQYGKPVDVFSLGCVMIHLMTHDWPDTGTCDNAALSEIEKRKPYLDRIQEPRELKELIIRCLMDDPKHRLTIDTVMSEVEKLKDCTFG